jgi:DNA primase
VYDETENISVAEFILSNIEEILEDFDSKLYQQVAKECHRMVVGEEKISPQYFIGHSDPNISELAVDLLHLPWEYSPGWEERDLYLTSQKMPEQNFTKDSVSALMQFKLRKIIRLCEKNQERLKEMKDSGDMAQMMRLLKVQTRLNDMRNELAKQLGTVVLK